MFCAIKFYCNAYSVTQKKQKEFVKTNKIQNYFYRSPSYLWEMATEKFFKNNEIERIHVGKCKNQTRIYDYLVDKLETIPSRKGIKKALTRKQIFLNNVLAKSGDYVFKGDVIKIYENTSFSYKEFKIELNVLFEDNELAVVEKPAGIAVSGNTFKTLQNALPSHLEKSTAKDSLPIPLPAHRLDSLTHGLLVVAKTHSMRIALGKLFENRQVYKVYTALVQGELEGRGKLNIPINGKSALTYFQSLTVFKSIKNGWVSKLQLSPITGRKHQLRIHLSQLGFPIIGDTLYGKKGNVLKHKGLFLASTGISFIHPTTQENLHFEIAPPNKFNRFLEREKRWVERVSCKE